MTIRQKIKLNMYLAIRNLRNKFMETVKAIPKFEQTYGSLMEHIDQIQSVSEQQGINKKGLAAGKRRLKKELISITFKNATRLAILAKTQKDLNLLGEVKLNESSLINLPGVTLRDKARVIYDRTEANLANLGEQGVTPETQKEFLAIITAFNNALSMPRTGVAETRQATTRLSELYDQADEIIKMLDMIVESVKDEQPGFYTAYRSSRKLVDINSGRVSLKAAAIDLSSHEPLKGVFFRFMPKGLKGGPEEIVKKTADKGGFQVRNMTPGTYQVMISKHGYKEMNAEVVIPEGERAELMVELEKE